MQVSGTLSCAVWVGIFYNLRRLVVLTDTFTFTRDESDALLVLVRREMDEMQHEIDYVLNYVSPEYYSGGADEHSAVVRSMQADLARLVAISGVLFDRVNEF